MQTYLIETEIESLSQQVKYLRERRSELIGKDAITETAMIQFRDEILQINSMIKALNKILSEAERN